MNIAEPRPSHPGGLLDLPGRMSRPLVRPAIVAGSGSTTPAHPGQGEGRGRPALRHRVATREEAKDLKDCKDIKDQGPRTKDKGPKGQQGSQFCLSFVSLQSF